MTAERVVSLPEWLVFSDIRPISIKVYGVMASQMPDAASGQVQISIRRLAGLSKLSCPSLHKAIVELEAIGALMVMPNKDSDGSAAANTYVLAKRRGGF